MLKLRRNTPTRAEQISQEIGECRDHLREVATLIAGGAAERFAPRVEHAKELVSPKVDKAREMALHGLESMTTALGGEQKKHRASWPMMLGMMGLGLALGVVAARLMQHYSHGRHWHEYEPEMLDGMEETAEETKNMARTAKETAQEVGGTMRDVAADVKDTVKKAAGNVADSMANGAKKLKP